MSINIGSGFVGNKDTQSGSSNNGHFINQIHGPLSLLDELFFQLVFQCVNLLQ
jgi:hypothetical protein